mmetsp:Transcript_3597/g.7675  ORF Transcript_3597/g.7675 Transcript_3597/m.7675 type:complete len:212 (-) Transcript_3597:685-1320(-)
MPNTVLSRLLVRFLKVVWMLARAQGEGLRCDLPLRLRACALFARAGRGRLGPRFKLCGAGGGSSVERSVAHAAQPRMAVSANAGCVLLALRSRWARLATRRRRGCMPRRHGRLGGVHALRLFRRRPHGRAVAARVARLALLPLEPLCVPPPRRPKLRRRNNVLHIVSLCNDRVLAARGAAVLDLPPPFFKRNLERRAHADVSQKVRVVRRR